MYMGERVSGKAPSPVPTVDKSDGEGVDQLALPEVAAGRTIQAVRILYLV